MFFSFHSFFFIGLILWFFLSVLLFAFSFFLFITLYHFISFVCSFCLQLFFSCLFFSQFNVVYQTLSKCYIRSET